MPLPGDCLFRSTTNARSRCNWWTNSPNPRTDRQNTLQIGDPRPPRAREYAAADRCGIRYGREATVFFESRRAKCGCDSQAEVYEAIIHCMEGRPRRTDRASPFARLAPFSEALSGRCSREPVPAKGRLGRQLVASRQPNRRPPFKPMAPRGLVSRSGLPRPIKVVRYIRYRPACGRVVLIQGITTERCEW